MAKIKKKKKNISSEEIISDVTGETTKIKKKKSKKKQDPAIEETIDTNTAKTKEVVEKDSSEKPKKPAKKSKKEAPEQRVSIKNIRLSLRVAGKVSSITLDTTIVGLWMLFCTDDDPSDYKLIRGRINEFVYANLSAWGRPNAKGLSEYIINRMIRACLDQTDFKLYKKFVKCISDKR